MAFPPAVSIGNMPVFHDDFEDDEHPDLRDYLTWNAPGHRKRSRKSRWKQTKG